MANNALISSITVPVNVSGAVTNVTYDIKDAYARERLSELSSALYWIGVTTTELSDGDTTHTTITVNSETVTPGVGGVAQYTNTSGHAIEFVWNGTAWQELGEGNLGSLAFKNSASGSYTPAGSVSVTDGDDTTTTVNSITAVGTLPVFTVSGEVLTFDAGTLPTKGADTTVVTASGTRTASFSGTAATITVS